MWVFDRQTLHFLAVNPAAVRQYGYSEEQFLRMTIADIRPAETVPELMLDVARRRPGLQEPEVWKHCRKDGTIIDVEVVCHDLEFQESKAMLVAAYDVTARAAGPGSSAAGGGKIPRDFRLRRCGNLPAHARRPAVNVNQAFAQMHGYDSPKALLAEVTNAATQLFVEPQRMMEAAEAAATQGIVRGAEVELYRKDRSRFWVMVNLRAVVDPAGKVVLFEGTAEDITDRKAAEAQVNFLAYHDALTGLPNRALFMDRLESALASARRREEKLAVLFLDLDRFKNINDSLGHSIGDQLLKVVAERLKESVREQDTVARLGGDEFLIMLNAADHAVDPALAAHRLMNAMTRPFIVQGHMLSTSCSIGVCVFPDQGEDGETLIKNADAAMYCAKDDGSNRVRVFADSMNRPGVARVTLENCARLASES